MKLRRANARGCALHAANRARYAGATAEMREDRRSTRPSPRRRRGQPRAAFRQRRCRRGPSGAGLLERGRTYPKRRPRRRPSRSLRRSHIEHAGFNGALLGAVVRKFADALIAFCMRNFRGARSNLGDVAPRTMTQRYAAVSSATSASSGSCAGPELAASEPAPASISRLVPRAQSEIVREMSA